MGFHPTVVFQGLSWLGSRPYAERVNIEDFIVGRDYRLTVRIRGEDEETVTGRVVGYSSAWFQSPESVLEVSLLVLDTSGELRALKSYSLDQIQGAELF
jgi:hypothetical protein